jgi:gliding motility-associated-like protein
MKNNQSLPGPTMTMRFLALSLVMLIALCNAAQAQSVDVGPPDTSVCNGFPITLTAITTGVGTNPVFTSLQLPSDDVHSQVVNIGFDFDYFGNTYNQVVVSSNSYITFNLGTAGTGSPWAIGAASPTPGVPDNAIMFPWQDTNPGAGSGGTNAADCGDGTFVVDFVDIAMFSCTDLSFSMQVVLYEQGNIIDTYITNKPLCTSWNGGAAIHGLENINGTQSVIVPGRNYPTQWQATNDAVRFTPNGAGSYTIDQTIPFNPIPVGTENIQWTDGAGNILGSTNSITVTPSAPTWYYCTFQSACSAITVKDSILVTLGNVNITTSKQDVTCFGLATGTITVDPVGSNFPVSIALEDAAGQTVAVQSNVNTAVTFEGLVAGTYSATVTDAVGCETSLTVTITEPTELELAASHTDILCTGDNNGTATATATGGTTPYSLVWSDQFQQTTNTIENLGPGPYRVTVTDAKGCALDTTIVVTQPLPIMMQFTVGADTCMRHDGAIRTTTLGGTPPFTYVWNSIPDSAAYEVDDIANTNLISQLTHGEYSVTIVDDNGCTKEGTVNVPLIVPPSASFSTISKPEDMIDPEVEFLNESTAAETYQWHFGDGSVSSQRHGTHVYDAPGNYLVMLIAYNDPIYGCADTTFRYIFVEPLFTFYVPNSFTPDGDGINDEFKPMGENFDYETYNLKIYDRWGSIIWQTDNPERGWNGKHQTSLEPLKNGVYIYVFTLKKFNNFEPKVIKGSFSLYRNKG